MMSLIQYSLSCQISNPTCVRWVPAVVTGVQPEGRHQHLKLCDVGWKQVRQAAIGGKAYGLSLIRLDSFLCGPLQFGIERRSNRLSVICRPRVAYVFIVYRTHP